MAYVDLHTHTNYSDGTCSPAELLSLVRQSGVVAFAVTDHDTLNGYRAVKELLQPGDPELVSGVELSVSINDDDVHLLAYLFDPDDPALNRAFADFRVKRHRRGKEIVERLRKLGIDVPFQAVEEAAEGSVIGRPHIADTLARLKKVGSYQEAFDRYISRTGPAYVPKAFFEPAEAIRMVHNAGGLAVLAHPMIDGMIRHAKALWEMGLDGIEVRHSNHSKQETDRLIKWAQKYDLLFSGGSDFHGRGDRHGMVGSQKVPVQYLEDMKRQAQKRRG